MLLIDASGNLKHSYTGGGSNIDLGEAILQTQDNSIILVGNTDSNDNDVINNNGTKDIIVIKLN